MHAKACSNKDGFKNFVSEYMSPEFQAKLRRAVQKPHSEDGKYVLKRVMPILTSGGRQTVFGAVERYNSKAEILALARRFGPAPAFLTFAIDDVNHPTAIRLALRSSSNSIFPSTVSTEAHEAMKQGFRFEEEGDIQIPTGWCERAKVLVQNPVGAALVYKKLVHDVLTILVGRKPSNCSGDNRRTVKTDVDRWDPDSEPGIVGSADAFFGKTETTGRGSLHFHVVLWAGISPELLEAASDLEDVCKIIGDVLDSHYSAELPRHCHLADLATKCMRRYANDSETFSKLDTAKRAMQLPPCPEELPAAFSAHVEKTICTCGIHEHCFTCKKPPNGWHGCRLCMPRGFCTCTKPVQLGINSVSGGVIAKKVGNQGAPVVMKDDLYPLKSPDNRTIVWEPKRRQLKALLPLPPRQNKIGSSASSEDESGPLPFAKERREFILNQLYSSMRESREVSTVEFDPLRDNGNWLFAALQKGLIRVRPESHLCSLTMAEFRTKLMDHLDGHLSEVDNVRGSGRYIPSSKSLCVCQWKGNAERLSESVDLPDFSMEDYKKQMKEAAADKCFWGGLLEVRVFAHLCDVNVVIVLEDDFWGLDDYACVDDGAPTIILSVRGHNYQLVGHIGGTEASGVLFDDYEYWNKEKFYDKEVDLYRPCRISEEESSSSASFFYSLLQGLADVTALCPNTTSVSELKTDFHAYSNANPTEAFDGALLREYDIDTLARGGDAAVLNWVAREKGVTVARYKQSDGSFVRERVFEGTCLVFSRLCGCCDWRRCLRERRLGLDVASAVR
jgi:hypothetical protein